MSLGTLLVELSGETGKSGNKEVQSLRLLMDVIKSAEILWAYFCATSEAVTSSYGSYHCSYNLWIFIYICVNQVSGFKICYGCEKKICVGSYIHPKLSRFRSCGKNISLINSLGELQTLGLNACYFKGRRRHFIGSQ